MNTRAKIRIGGFEMASRSKISAWLNMANQNPGEPQGKLSVVPEPSSEPATRSAELGIEKIQKTPPPPPRIVEVPGNRETLPIRQIYLDDLHQIHMALERQCSEIQYETEDFRFWHPDSIAKVPQDRISKLTITAYNPQVKITAEHVSFELRTFDDSESSKTIYYELWSILNRRRSRMVRILDRSLLGLVSMVIAAGLLSLSASLSSNETVKTAALAAMGPAMLACGIGVPFLTIRWLKSADVAAPYAKREKPRPWYSSDTMKITLVSVLLTALLTAIITYSIATNN
jgi:hypothetical protein